MQDALHVGDGMYDLLRSLFPIPRSITGDGVRESLRILAARLPIEVHEVPSGTPVLDWTIPPEWNVRDAWIEDPTGHRVVDFHESNLCVLGYSEPVRRRVGADELREHLHSLPDRPTVTPYRTSYYERRWGFCVPHDVVTGLGDGDYDVCIDATFDEGGSLTYGELVVPGHDSGEVLISTHVCHPSLANDNLSGIVVAAALAEHLMASDPSLTYRFLFVPGTIGSIAWLARHEAAMPDIRHGLVLTGLGDPSPFTYKRSRSGAGIDRAVEHVLRQRGEPWRALDFSPYGYDERQYCSPGFDLPVGRLCRATHGEHPEYHTSDDDLSFVTPDALRESFGVLVDVVAVLEGDACYRNLSPKGEPQLGRRGLYRSIGATMDRASTEMALLWVLNQSDGTASLLDIAERADLPFSAIRDAADLLVAAELLQVCSA